MFSTSKTAWRRNNVPLTAEQEERLAKVMAVPVHRGKGSRGIQDACIMQMTDWVYRNADHWTDKPICVSPVITAFMIAWNDSLDDEDRQKLKLYIAKTIGTKTNAKDERKRSYMALDWYCRVSAPTWLRLIGKNAEATAIESCDPIVDAKSVAKAQAALDAGRAVAAAAWDAAGAAARDAAGAAAGVAADAAAGDAARDAARAANASCALCGRAVYLVRGELKCDGCGEPSPWGCWCPPIERERVAA